MVPVAQHKQALCKTAEKHGAIAYWVPYNLTVAASVAHLKVSGRLLCQGTQPM